MPKEHRGAGRRTTAVTYLHPMRLTLFHSWSELYCMDLLWSLNSPVKQSRWSTYFSFGEVEYRGKQSSASLAQILPFLHLLFFLCFNFPFFFFFFFVRSPTVSQGQFSSHFKLANCLALMLFTSNVAPSPQQEMTCCLVSLQANLYGSS